MASSPTRLQVDVNSSGFRKCESQKVGYQTYSQAFDAAELMMQLGKVKPGCHITPYECIDCGEWHVGNRVIVQIGPRT